MTYGAALSQFDDGGIDGEALEAWVTAARDKLAAVDRAGTGERVSVVEVLTAFST